MTNSVGDLTDCRYPVRASRFDRFLAQRLQERLAPRAVPALWVREPLASDGSTPSAGGSARKIDTVRAGETALRGAAGA